MSGIEPAMTAEQWAMALACPPGVIYGFNQQDEGEMTRHRMAAMCLYETPFGFAREDVRTLRTMAVTDHEGFEREGSPDAFLSSLADRIAALLPPEKEP